MLQGGTAEVRDQRRKQMSGTIVCGVTDSPEGRAAAQLAGALSARLGLRLVLAHVVDALPGDALDSITGRQLLTGAERTLTELRGSADGHEEVESRIAVGDRAERLAEIVAEEGADLIVIGSRGRGLRGRHLRCTLARELEAATPVPVLIAPPQTRARTERRLAFAEASAAR
jgi:nucleotide-binding universal stress UspA family protein